MTARHPDRVTLATEGTQEHHHQQGAGQEGGVYEERRKMAQVESKRKGYPGGFKKGVHYNPDGEFKKGHVESDETKAKRIAAVKRWCRMNPEKVMKRALKIAESRRKNKICNMFSKNSSEKSG